MQIFNAGAPIYPGPRVKCIYPAKLANISMALSQGRQLNCECLQAIITVRYNGNNHSNNIIKVSQNCGIKLVLKSVKEWGLITKLESWSWSAVRRSGSGLLPTLHLSSQSSVRLVCCSLLHRGSRHEGNNNIKHKTHIHSFQIILSYNCAR